MNTTREDLEDLTRRLTDEERGRVREIVERLLARRTAPIGPKLRQTWSGSLSEYRDRFTSLDLQGKAAEWRLD